MRRTTRYPINDIIDCLNQARVLMKGDNDSNCKDRTFHRVFASLAGDEEVGFLAYVIWRGRSRFLSSLITYSSFIYDGDTGNRPAREPVARGSV